MSSKKLIVPNGRDQMPMFREIANSKHFTAKEKEVKSILADDEEGVKEKAKGESGLITVETDTKEKLDQLLKRFTPTGQKAFIYLCNYAIQNGYINKFEVDINELLEVLGLTRTTRNIDKLFEYLLTFQSVKFQYTAETWKKGKHGERRGFADKLDSHGNLLSWVDLIKSGRKRSRIEVGMGRWFEHFSSVRKNNDAYLLTLPMDCLKVDTNTFPYAFGCPFRMAQHARVNDKSKPKDGAFILSFKQVIEGVEPWKTAAEKIRKRGFDDRKENRSLVTRFTLSMEHAEKPFGLNWEWADGIEPQTLAEAEKARVKFRFSQPLKNVKTG